MKNIVLSLYDFTGLAVRGWAERGYECYCFDTEHAVHGPIKEEHPSGGSISFVHLDLHDAGNLDALARDFSGRVAMLLAFPVCTDLAVSGARHFATKALLDPDFQTRAAAHARWCGELGESLGCPYLVENPVSRLSTLWRPPDHLIHPFEFGGYIPEEDAPHPQWPEYIAPRDAYSKKTCFWTGGGFVLPPKKPVPCDSYGNSTQQRKLGGKSRKTKTIRSATPRGVFLAICQQHAQLIPQMEP